MRWPIRHVEHHSPKQESKVSLRAQPLMVFSSLMDSSKDDSIAHILDGTEDDSVWVKIHFQEKNLEEAGSDCT